MVAQPEFQPLLASVRQDADLKTAKVVGPPARAFDDFSGGEKLCPRKLRPEFASRVQRQMKVEVEGVAVHAVVPDRVSAHDEEAEAGVLNGASNLQETLGRAHMSESSQPRLPQASS